MFAKRVVRRLLGGRRGEPVAHLELEHAHWDRVERRWIRHEEEPETLAA